MKCLCILKIDFELIYFKNYHEEREFWTEVKEWRRGQEGKEGGLSKTVYG